MATLIGTLIGALLCQAGMAMLVGAFLDFAWGAIAPQFNLPVFTYWVYVAVVYIVQYCFKSSAAASVRK